MRLRRRIAELCAQHNESCALLLDGYHPRLGDSLRLRRESIFCLEPPGYGILRRSAVDSFLLGCIPVFFMTKDDFARYTPRYFQTWAANASVLVSPSAFLRGEVNLFEALANLSTERVAGMQALIAANAKRLLYGIDFVRHDALDTLLEAHWEGIVHHAHGPYTVFGVGLGTIAKYCKYAGVAFVLWLLPQCCLSFWVVYSRRRSLRESQRR